MGDADCRLIERGTESMLAFSQFFLRLLLVANIATFRNQPHHLPHLVLDGLDGKINGNNLFACTYNIYFITDEFTRCCLCDRGFQSLLSLGRKAPPPCFPKWTTSDISQLKSGKV